MIKSALDALLDATEMPTLIAGVNLQNLNLTAVDGFVLSRIDGHTNAKSLSVLTGLDDAKLAQALLRLRDAGVVQFATKPAGKSATTQSASIASKSAPAEAATEQYSDIVFSVIDLNEDVDIGPDKKKRILYYEAKLGKWHHFKLLGLEQAASSDDVRRAYFQASKEFHPDAFFRKRLGSYAARIERIFKAMKVAYDILSNKETRDAYEQTIVWPLSAEEENHLYDAARRRFRENKRSELLQARRLKRNPMLERIKKAREFYDLGLEAMRKERWLEASNHLRLAIVYDPRKAEFQTAFSEVVGHANLMRSQSILKSIETSIDVVERSTLYDNIDELLRLAIDSPGILAQCSNLLRQHGDIRKAFEVAQRAAAVGERSIAAQTALLESAQSAEKWNSAQRAVERLLELEPQNSALKSRLKQIKKMI